MPRSGKLRPKDPTSSFNYNPRFDFKALKTPRVASPGPGSQFPGAQPNCGASLEGLWTCFWAYQEVRTTVQNLVKALAIKAPYYSNIFPYSHPKPPKNPKTLKKLKSWPLKSQALASVLQREDPKLCSRAIRLLKAVRVFADLKGEECILLEIEITGLQTLSP